jgi:hypothetical protein
VKATNCRIDREILNGQRGMYRPPNTSTAVLLRRREFPLGLWIHHCNVAATPSLSIQLSCHDFK